MKTNRSIVLILLLLSLAAADESQRQQSTPTSRVGETAKGVTYKIDQGRSYHLIQVASLDKKYLFFSLTVDPIYSHLNISLTLIKEGQQRPLRECLREEVDSCYVSKRQLEENETIFVAVHAPMEIEYQLETYWSDVEHVKIGEEIRFIFSKTNPRQLYHLELQGYSYEQVRIVIKPATRRYAFDYIKMYGSFGEDSEPSQEEHDFKSFHLWQDAQGVYLNRDEVKDENINLILYGSTETVYTMVCELVDKTHHQLQLGEKIYDYLEVGETNDYFLGFKDSQGKLTYDVYVFELAIFTGVSYMEFYTDKLKTKRLSMREPFMYMGDMQYLFFKEEIETLYKEGIYVEISSKDRICTYMLEFEGREKSAAVRMHEHIYEFMQVEGKQLAYFEVSKYKEDARTQVSNINAIVSLVEAIGNVTIEFRRCHRNATHTDCKSEQYQAYSEEIHTHYRSLGTKKTFEIILSDSFWRSSNAAEDKTVILVVLTNVDSNKTAFAAVEHNIGNRPQFLREGKPIESHVLKNEYKVYKYVNQDPSITKVKFYLNKLSGDFNAMHFRHQPSQKEMTSAANFIGGQTFEVTGKLTEEPVVILIEGKDSCTFSIIVQPIHKDKEQINSIVLSEEVEFKVKIGPAKYEVLEVVPISHSIFFSYKASGAVEVCPLNQDDECDQADKIDLSNSGQLTFRDFKEHSQLIEIRNPSSSKTVEVTTVYHSKEQQHCENRKIGHLYKELVDQGQCFRTVLTQIADFQVRIIREQLGQLSYTMFLCQKLLNFESKQNGEETYRISKEQIKVNCLDEHQKVFSFVSSGKAEKNEKGKLQFLKDKISIKYLVQYLDGRIVLPDGIGYHGRQISTEKPIKQFTYDLLNKVETTIVLTTPQKLFFLVKFIEESQKQTANITTNEFDLSSPNEQFYFLDTIYLKITPDQIKQSGCQQCHLLIYIYSKEEVGTEVSYTLEATQNYVHLEQGKPVMDYLVENSKKYYGFSVRGKGTLFIEVADNNLNCAQIYYSNSEYPDERNHIDKAFDGELIREVDTGPQEQTYHIAVKARKNCAYSITASLSSGSNHVVKLMRGTLGFLNLDQGQVRFFTFRHMSEQALKILSLHTFGHVEMYLNKTTPHDVLALMNQKKIDHRGFAIHGNHKNRVVLDKSNKEFCKDCFYILAVEARRHTESSIFLGDSQTLIPISEDKVVNDILTKKNDYTRGTFYLIENGTIDLMVHSGEVQIKLEYHNQSTSSSFSKSKEQQHLNFTFKQTHSYGGSVVIVFKALKDDTVYSAHVKSQRKVKAQQTGKRTTQITSGQPNYVYFQTQIQNCLTGYLKRSDERLFLSFYGSERHIAKDLNLTASISGEATKIAEDTTRNVISVTFIDLANKPLPAAVPYQLCAQTDHDSFSVTVMQSEDTSLLPQNVEMVAVRKQTYDIYSDGDILLDLFQCRGTAMVAHGSKRSQLQTAKPKLLDMLGMADQPHAMHIKSLYGNTLLRVQGQLSLIRWLKINEQTQQGVGYYVYSAGSFRYDSSFGKLQFYVQPIKQVKQYAKTKIVKIDYHLYLSPQVDHLSEAAQCERYIPGSVLLYNIAHQSIAPGSFKFTVDKKHIKGFYDGKNVSNLYAVIVADATIETLINTTEQYRFIYKDQQVPHEIFMPSKIESYSFNSVILFLIVLIAFILIFTWACAKVIVPLMGRLKNRVLVEENALQASKEKDDKSGDLEPPPSSDRQGINMMAAPSTEDKM